ncbi:hypothetical protein [Thermolongibacillus altinsuensis]|uniref:hypothetical protein n=1 Tax=Thermolongibacillus altinsuensis TaxID=575256 RepID=UPI0027962C17|nr:hypothetical protein [Thermolongibacillus altinsuensis]
MNFYFLVTHLKTACEHQAWALGSCHVCRTIHIDVLQSSHTNGREAVLEYKDKDM